MLIIRPVANQDIDAILQLAKDAGVGVTTLPVDRDAITENINHSIQAFAGTAQTTKYYFFVLEDLATKKIVGTSAIDAAVGGDLPFYSYKVTTKKQISHEFNINETIQILNLVNDYQETTELCTLFLHADYRKDNNAQLLSYSRLLYMAQFPDEFSQTVFAEMRGVSDEHGHSPFWDSLGKKFLFMDFPTADRLTSTTNKQFISDLMPQHPIYVSLLSEQAQQVIGKTHANTKGAAIMLQKQNFNDNHYVDIFDAGPVLEARLPDIHTIKESQCVVVKNIAAQLQGNDMLLSNARAGQDFRVCKANVKKLNETDIEITQQTADALRININDELRIGNLL